MYQAPVDDILHTLKHVAGLADDLNQGRFDDLSDDLLEAILTEAGRFASERIAPLNPGADAAGTPLDDGVVATAPGFAETYGDWAEGGWNSLAGPQDYGGQGLPVMVAVAATEMWNSASMAFGLCPILTGGAIEAVEQHGSDALRETYLEKLVTGQWTGTMNLTEPQAGSDLNALRSRAVPVGDGTYRIFGQKIFITYGEHDMAENIVHLVLARLPDAPAGTRGISLFLVPKFIPDQSGQPGPRNDVFCQSVEHKLGIHGSPTCVMIYGDGYVDGEPGALGWLIGEENRGLACMFTMMNNARLNVGIQGVAVAEAACQRALAYANDRRQGRAPGQTADSMSAIVRHPDVMRNLLTMITMTRAARAICYACARAIDLSRTGEGEAVKLWKNRASLLTPIAKAFSTDIGCEVANIGVQVHGGMGFIEETGAAQLLRDARINPIYEGTNGIQAIDLVSRKLPLASGDAVAGYIEELRGVVEQVRGANVDGFGDTADCLSEALDDLERSKDWLLAAQADGHIAEALAGATPFLRLFGLAAGGVYLAKSALAEEVGERVALARFFAENCLAETGPMDRAVRQGADNLLIAGAALASE